MMGPKERGHWTGHIGSNGGNSYGHLRYGQHYVVAETFSDFDCDVHHAGERFTFLAYSYLPYDNGLSLFVAVDDDDKSEWLIRLLDDGKPDSVATRLESLVVKVKS